MFESYKGQVLVAGPSLQDPNFQRSVILICEHSSQGALGIIYNRPSSSSLAEVMPPMADCSLAEERLYLGGPMQRESLFIIHDDQKTGGDNLGEGLYFSASPEHLEDLVTHLNEGDSVRARLFAGYAGWGEEQLEFEMSQGAWILAPMDQEQILAGEGQNAWKQALKSLGGRYAILAEAPPDPRLN